MTSRTTDQRIAELEAKIEAIKQRAERKRVRANPAVRFMSMALRSLDKALNSSDDAVLKKALDEARATVASCLGLIGVKPKAARRTLTPRPRAHAASTDNVNGSSQPDANDLLTYLKNNPGSSSERITKEFSTDAGTLRPVMRKLIDEGKVKTKGERRGTRYFVGA